MERGELRNSSDDPSQTLQGAWLLVSCFWCGRRHRGERPLAVCPGCAAGFSTPRVQEMHESDPLGAEAIDAVPMRVQRGRRLPGGRAGSHGGWTS